MRSIRHDVTRTDPRSIRVHPTALIEPGVDIGPRSAVWDNVHIRGPAQIGHDCIVGEKTYIAYGVRIGNYVKINAQVYVCTGVTIEDRVMLAAGVIFTNDRFPRAFSDDGLASSEPTEDTLSTTVREGATLGARVVVGPGLEIGRFAMVGMGAVVTHDLPDHAFAYGVPARLHGWVCACGWPLLDESFHGIAEGDCGKCGRGFWAQRTATGTVRLVCEPAAHTSKVA
jgi:acetyltransferase-like isoleucine patch superfamily enzyme